MKWGTIHKKQYLCLHRHIGKVDLPGKDTKLEIKITEPTGEPFVVHSDGRVFSLSWNDIVEMAVEAFDANTQKVQL